MNQIKIRPATLNDVPEINDILNNEQPQQLFLTPAYRQGDVQCNW